MSTPPSATSSAPHSGELPDKRDFKKLWEDAVKSYNAGTQPKKKQLHRPVLISLPVDYCTSDQVIKHFESQKELFKVFRSSGEKVRGVLTPIVDILLVLKEGAEGASDLITGGDTILGAIGSLLEATKGVSELYDAVEALLKEVLASLKRFKIHFEGPATLRGAIKDIIVDALVQVLMAVALATKYCNLAVADVPWYKRVLRVFWRRAKDYFLVLTDKADVQGILEELRTLAEREKQLVITASYADGREIKDNVAVVKAVVEVIKQKVDYDHHKRVIDGLRSWLDSPNPRPLNYDMKKQLGSCEWFFDAQYDEWKTKKDFGIYWVHGNAGAGKSVLSFSIVDQLKADERRDASLTVAYFHFDFKDLKKKDCRAVVSSLVSQLGTRFQDCLAYLEGERARSPDSPTYEHLLSMLSHLLSLTGRTCLVIDALDECPQPAREKGLLRLIEHLCDQVDHDKDVHLLITSRPENDIQDHMLHFPARPFNFQDAIQHKVELEVFVSSQLSVKKAYQWSDELEKQVRRILVEKSKGMFLWVTLQMQPLRRCLNLIDVERVLKELPEDLNATYERILMDFAAPGFSVDRARRVFECVAFAKRPLSPVEVAVVLSSDFGSDINVPAVSVLEVHANDPEEFIRENCPRLLDIVPGRGGKKVVQFIHFSALEYLISPALKESTSRAHQFAFDEEAAHLTLMRLCLSTLVGQSSLSDFQSYTYGYWVNHISSRNDDVLGELLFRFLHLGSSSFTRWASGVGIHKDYTALHMAAQLGLCHHVTRILETPHGGSATPFDNVARVRDQQNETALHTATRYGHAEVASALLDHGCLFGDTNEVGDTALHLAASSGPLDVVRTLLDHPAADESDTVALQCRAHGKYGRTTLHLAAMWGHTEIARVLLSHGALVDDIDEDGWIPLHFAAYNEHLDVLRVLLEHRAVDGSDTAVAQCSTRNNAGQTALHLAASRVNSEVCRVLLDHGSLVDATDNNGDTPLQLAEEEGHWVKHRGKVKGCHPDVERVLLECGATPLK